MKIEMGMERPEHFRERWPGQYDIFSHFEYAAGIPSILFAITTVKENGQPNVCPHAWSSFSGGPEAFYAILAGLMTHTHTYANIRRTGEFVVNFLSPDYHEGLMRTIRENDPEVDEFAAGGFTPEVGQVVTCPRIAQAFLSLECRFHQGIDLPGPGTLILGQVVHLSMAQSHAQGLKAKFGPQGYMFNIHAPMDLLTGEQAPTALGICNILREVEAD